MKTFDAAKAVSDYSADPIEHEDIDLLLRLRNQIDDLEGHYRRELEKLQLKLIAGARVDKSVTVEKILLRLLCDQPT